MFLLANFAARAGVAAGLDALRRGSSPLDVLEAVLREAENDRTEPSVGLGGWPNMLGEVELDASLMEGTTRRTGSVAALTGFLHPVSVARQVMERLPHEILAGSGAGRFRPRDRRGTGGVAHPGERGRVARVDPAEPAGRRGTRGSNPFRWRISYGARLREWRIETPPSRSSPTGETSLRVPALAAGPSSTRAAWAIPPSSAADTTPIRDAEWRRAPIPERWRFAPGGAAAGAGTAAGVAPRSRLPAVIDDVRQLREGLISDLVPARGRPSGNFFVASDRGQGRLFLVTQGWRQAPPRAGDSLADIGESVGGARDIGSGAADRSANTAPPARPAADSAPAQLSLTVHPHPDLRSRKPFFHASDYRPLCTIRVSLNLE